MWLLSCLSRIRRRVHVEGTQQRRHRNPFGGVTRTGFPIYVNGLSATPPTPSTAKHQLHCACVLSTPVRVLKTRGSSSSSSSSSGEALREPATEEERRVRHERTATTTKKKRPRVTWNEKKVIAQAAWHLKEHNKLLKTTALLFKGLLAMPQSPSPVSMYVRVLRVYVRLYMFVFVCLCVCVSVFLSDEKAKKKKSFQKHEKSANQRNVFLNPKREKEVCSRLLTQAWWTVQHRNRKYTPHALFNHAFITTPQKERAVPPSSEDKTQWREKRKGKQANQQRGRRRVKQEDRTSRKSSLALVLSPSTFT